MFTHQLPNSEKTFSIKYSKYAENHFLNKFQKKYQGKIWEYTENSIKQDLSRLRMKNNTTQFTQQIDELKYVDDKWIAKYDFKIAGTKVSTKDSGNRCVVFIDNKRDYMEILLIYHKDDIPKNKAETRYIMDVIRDIYELEF